MTSVTYTQLSLGPDVDDDRMCREHKDYPVDPGDRHRITRFAPLPPVGMAPALGMATDPRLLRALAVSGTGWVNRDGRVIAKGTTWEDKALLALPETAALVAAQLRLCQEEEAMQYDDPARGTEEVISAVEVDMDDLLGSGFDNMLDDAGWMRVDLCRDRNVKVMAPYLDGMFLDPYREHLVAIADGLGCRMLSGHVSGEYGLQYDSVETEGLPFARGLAFYQQGPPEPPEPEWRKGVGNEPDEDYGESVAFGR